MSAIWVLAIHVLLSGCLRERSKTDIQPKIIGDPTASLGARLSAEWEGRTDGSRFGTLRVRIILSGRCAHLQSGILVICVEHLSGVGNQLARDPVLESS